jgi:uncharacterized protein (DUF488 family)
MELLTVGHSNHGEKEFLDLLRGAGVTALADVRVSPRSRYEHFNRSALAGSLEAAGIHYAYLGEELGGRREPLPDSVNRAWDEEAFRGYADHMASEEFAAGIERLEELGAEHRVAVMCAEGDWRHCHRRLLADALLARGHAVTHISPDGSLDPHELTASAVVDDDVVTYPEVQTSLDL